MSTHARCNDDVRLCPVIMQSRWSMPHEYLCVTRSALVTGGRYHRLLVNGQPAWLASTPAVCQNRVNGDT